MSDLAIPDISEFQGSVDHQALVAGLRSSYGAAVVIARLCYGDLHVDAQADANVDGLRAAGADALGWYLYLIAGRDPVAQATTLGRVLLAHGGLRRNEFVVADDEESTGGDEAPRVNAALAALDVQLQTPNPSGEDWWYSGLNFALAHDLYGARGRRWVAAYGVPEPTAPHDLWQDTDAATFPGVSGPCDASIFHGGLADFLALIGAGQTPSKGAGDGMGVISPDVTGERFDRLWLAGGEAFWRNFAGGAGEWDSATGGVAALGSPNGAKTLVEVTGNYTTDQAILRLNAVGVLADGSAWLKVLDARPGQGGVIQDWTVGQAGPNQDVPAAAAGAPDDDSALAARLTKLEADVAAIKAIP